MRQTLFHIPYEISGVTLFGPAGILLWAWLAFSAGFFLWLVRRQGMNRDTLGHLPVLLIVAAGIAFLPRVFPDGLPIRGYGMMLLLAVVAAVGMAMYRARRMGIDPELIFALAFWIFVLGIIGARAFHVIQKWPEYQRDDFLSTVAAILNIPAGGLVVYGSLIGAAVAFLWFTRRHRLPPLALADLIAPSLLLGLAIGRVGCLMNGCCFGGVCELPWAVTFPPPSPPFHRQAIDGKIDLYGVALADDAAGGVVVEHVEPNSLAALAGLRSGQRLVAAQMSGQPMPRWIELPQAHEAREQLWAAYQTRRPLLLATAEGRRLELPPPPAVRRSLPVHPAQIYSAIGAGLVCLFLIAYYPFRRRDGEVLALFLTIYPIVRFLNESIRVDERGMFGTGLSIAQVVSLMLLAAAAALWCYVLFGRPKGSALPLSWTGSG